MCKHAQVETHSGLKQPVPPATPVTDELQQKLSAMAAVREMPDLARKEMTIGAGRDTAVKLGFGYECISKRQYWRK